jgi:hypothetical protein
MPFINTAGLTILGDGSQWFWSMAAFLAIPLTGYMILSQLRGQRSANRVAALSALQAEWDSERMLRHRLAVLMHDAAGTPGWPPSLDPVGNFFEHLALLEDHGDVGVDVVWETWGQAVQGWWLSNAAAIKEQRLRDPGLWDRWESLMRKMVVQSRRHGVPPVDLDKARGAVSSFLIPGLIERLRVEQEARAGVVPSWSPAQTADAPTAPAEVEGRQ